MWQHEDGTTWIREEDIEPCLLYTSPFDLVVVNLYPFADTVRSGAGESDVIEKIDIGGPSMVRGAAKNSATVAIVTDPTDYALVATRIENCLLYTSTHP